MSEEEKQFCKWRYEKYYKRVLKETKKVRVFSNKLKRVRSFVFRLKRIYISTNLYKGPKVPEGSAFKEGIILKYNMFYKDFKYALFHESFHYLFHMKRKIPQNRMELEANTGALILSGISPLLWKCFTKSFFDFKIFRKDVKYLLKRRYKVRKIEPEEYLWLKDLAVTYSKHQYFKKIEKAKRILSKLKLPTLERKFYKLPIVYWPGKLTIKDCVYLPNTIKNLSFLQKLYNDIEGVL